MEQIDADDHTLTIRSHAPVEDMVTITVCDTGAGIGPDAAEHLFDAFFTTKASGMGLGLSVSRTIVESHGGRLWVTQDSNSGTTFHLSLPIAERALDGSC